MKAELKAKISTIFLGAALAVLLVPGVAMADAVDLETSVVSDIPSAAALPTDLQNDEAQDDNTDADSVSTALEALATVEEGMQDDVPDSEDVDVSTDAPEAVETETPLEAQDYGDTSGFDEEHEMSWQIIDNADGTHGLSIACTGNGRMPNYSDANPAPWSSYASSVTSISLSGVPNIGEAAFKNFTALTFVDALVSSIGREAFYGCSSLIGVTLENRNWAGLNEIQESAFENCALTEVNIPQTVSYIGARAFYGCPFNNDVLIGFNQSNLETLGAEAFGSSIDFTLRFAGTFNRWQNIANRFNSSYGYASSPNVRCKYEITFDANDGSSGAFTIITTDVWGRLPNLPIDTPMRDGYDFDGWHTDPNANTPVDQYVTTFDSDSSVYAHWKEKGEVPEAPKIYQISFEPNVVNVGDMVVFMSSETNEYGILVTLPEGPEYPGYKFLGWFTAADDSGARIYNGHQFYDDDTVYAHWDPDPSYTVYTIYFNPNEGSYSGPASMKTDGNGRLTSFPSVEPTRDQYWFRYWSLDVFGLNPVELNETEFKSDATIYAYWEPYKIYTITLDANGGQLAGDISTVVTNEFGKLTELPAEPTNGSQNFAGWFDAPVDGMQILKDHIFYQNGAVIYAHWSSTPVYTIVFFLDDAASTPYSSMITNDLGKLDSLPVEPTREDFDFIGWFTVAGKQVEAGKTVFEDSADVFARWDPKPVYTISFAMNDGTSAVASTLTTNTKGKLASLPASPTRDGYMFIGWFDQAIDGIEVKANDTVFAANSTVYAHWEEPEYVEVIYAILDGAESTWDPEKSDNLEIRCEGELEQFDHVKVDGVMVDTMHYDLREGSTIISLKPSYLATLSEGDHDITFVYKDGGQGRTSFVIPAKPANYEPGNDEPGNNGDDNNYNGDEPIFIPGEPNIVQVADVNDGEGVSFTDNPKTGDSANVLALLVLMLIAAACFGGLKFTRRTRA